MTNKSEKLEDAVNVGGVKMPLLTYVGISFYEYVLMYVCSGGQRGGATGAMPPPLTGPGGGMAPPGYPE